MELKSLNDVRHAATGVASHNWDALDHLVWTSVFSTAPDLRDAARQAVLDSARSAGLYPASIHELYLARGRGDAPHDFTVPAVNVRGLAYDTARALMRARRKLEAGAVICEIARSEISYTDQRPAEYATVMLAAALREGLKGPVFIQGDHFQINAKKYAAAPEPEVEAVRSLAAEAMAAGFYNIDIDTSTLVDLSRPDLESQQEVNGTLCARLTGFIRSHEPKGMHVSVGGEIGEVGGKNSTPEELHAFMSVYGRALTKEAPGQPGMSKISIQVGTSHGGVVLPDGTIAQVKLDFQALETLSHIARTQYRMAGAVQHGASTLPAELFGEFPAKGACEIHLATEFQNMAYDHPAFPADLKRAIYERLRTAAADERKASDTDEQFFYKTRKKALGMFKRDLWSMPAATRAAIGATLEEKFTFLLETLRVGGTQALAERWAPAVPGAFPVVGAAVGAGKGPEDTSGLAD